MGDMNRDLQFCRQKVGAAGCMVSLFVCQGCYFINNRCYRNRVLVLTEMSCIEEVEYPDGYYYNDVCYYNSRD